MAEALVRTLKRDCVRVNPGPDAQTVIAQLPAWILTTITRCSTTGHYASSSRQHVRPCQSFRGNNRSKSGLHGGEKQDHGAETRDGGMHGRSSRLAPDLLGQRLRNQAAAIIARLRYLDSLRCSLRTAIVGYIPAVTSLGLLRGDTGRFVMKDIGPSHFRSGISPRRSLRVSRARTGASDGGYAVQRLSVLNKQLTKCLGKPGTVVRNVSACGRVLGIGATARDSYCNGSGLLGRSQFDPTNLRVQFFASVRFRRNS